MIRAYIEGHLVGETWGGGRGFIGHRVKIKERGLVNAVAQACKSGDFQGAKFSTDSYLVVESHVFRNRCDVVRTRVIDLVDLPSLSEYVDPDFYAYAERL